MVAMARRTLRDYKNRFDSAKDLEEKEYQRLRSSLGAVPKILAKAEVRALPLAQQAIAGDIRQVAVTKGAFDPPSVDSWETIKRKHPNAKLVRGMVVTVQKATEKAGKPNTRVGWWPLVRISETRMATR